jgi:hypothetical protein
MRAGAENASREPFNGEEASNLARHLSGLGVRRREPCQLNSKRRVDRIQGELPVNTQLQAFYNVVRPEDASTWQLRVQIQFLFPR